MPARRATPDEIKRIQQALSDRGFYLGAIDGIAGPETRKAIDAYQDSTGEEGTGALTAAQLIELGVITPPPVKSRKPCPISDFFSNLIAQKGAEFIINQLKDSPMNPLAILDGYKTYIIGVLSILTGIVAMLGWSIPGMAPIDPAQGWQLVLGGFGLLGIRRAINTVVGK